MDVRDVKVHAHRLIPCRRRLSLLRIGLRLHAIILPRLSLAILKELLLVFQLLSNQLRDFVLSDVYLRLDT